MGAAQDLAKCVTEPKMHHHAPPPKRLGSKLSSEAIRMAQNPDRDEHGLRNSGCQSFTCNEAGLWL